MIHLAHKSDKKVTFNIEIDSNGSGNWKPFKTIEIPSNGYRWHIFDEEMRGQWIRIKTDVKVQSATAWFNYSGNEERGNNPTAIFEGISHSESEDKSGAILWALGNNRRKLGIDASRQVDGKVENLGYYELDSALNLIKKDSLKLLQRVQKAAPKENNIRVDEASVIVKSENTGQRYRLPKGKADYTVAETFGWPRIAREVVTERDLMNCAGTFYELPSRMAGGIGRIRPVSTHNMKIYDFVSYRGLLVMSGINTNDYKDNSHIITSRDEQFALWAGALDDLWKLGKPRGVGGPWKETQIKAGEPSDPYLMTGFDKKEMHLKHNANETVTFKIEVDITGKGLWKTYDTFQVDPGATINHLFPDGFSAYWVRLKTNQDCKATAKFIYN